MRILSFDIGTKNLSFADIEIIGARPFTQFIVHEWNILDFLNDGDQEDDDSDPKKSSHASSSAVMTSGEGTIKGNTEKKKKNKPDIDTVSRRLIRALTTTFGNVDGIYDHVLIENQPVGMNPIMKTIQVIVYSYFQTTRELFGNAREVAMVSATLKLAEVNRTSSSTDKKMNYAERKKASVRVCRDFLLGEHPSFIPVLTPDMEETLKYRTHQTIQSSKGRLRKDKGMDIETCREDRSLLLSYFDRHRKKDDLADAMLQARSYYQVKLRKNKNNE